MPSMELAPIVQRVRKHYFEVQITVDGEPTGHIARVEVTLDRFEEVR